MRLSESSNVAAPGRCAHHPGITPGGVIVIAPMGRGVRVASPRVPASTLISHRRGGVRGRERAATLSACSSSNASTTGSYRRWRPGLSPAGRLANGRQLRAQHARATGSRPLCPSAPAQARRGSPGGSHSGAKGNGHARTKDIPAGIRGAGATQRAGNMPKGPVEPGNLRACRGGPLLELAGLAEAGGEPPGAPAACQRTRALEQAARCTRAGWAGAQRSAGAGSDMPSSVR
jgi:hypothetical protein